MNRTARIIGGVYCPLDFNGFYVVEISGLPALAMKE
jgi:hypothetical protein